MIRRFCVEYTYRAENNKIVGSGRAFWKDENSEDHEVEQIGHRDDVARKISLIIRFTSYQGAYAHQEMTDEGIAMSVVAYADSTNPEKAYEALKMLSPKLAELFQDYLAEEIQF